VLALFDRFKALHKLTEGQSQISKLGQWAAGLTAQMGKITLGIQGWFEGLKTEEHSSRGAPRLG